MTFEEFDRQERWRWAEKRMLAGGPIPDNAKDRTWLMERLSLPPASSGGLRQSYWNAALDALWAEIAVADADDGVYAISKSDIERLKAK